MRRRTNVRLLCSRPLRPCPGPVCCHRFVVFRCGDSARWQPSGWARVPAGVGRCGLAMAEAPRRRMLTPPPLGWPSLPGDAQTGDGSGVARPQHTQFGGTFARLPVFRPARCCGAPGLPDALRQASGVTTRRSAPVPLWKRPGRLGYADFRRHVGAGGLQSAAGM